MQSSGSDWVLAMVVGGGIVAVWLWILVLALRVPRERWSAAGQSKPLWIFLIVVLGLVGSALYLKLVAPTLSPSSE